MADHVLLVTVDSLRADYVYDSRAETPAMDDLADESVVYGNAFAQGPFTTFSMPSLFTSKYPSGLGYVEFSDSTVGVHVDDEPTVTEQLHAAGYETAGFHSNPLLSNLFGFDQGFDTFDARLPLSGTDALPGRAKILADKVLRLVRKHPYLPAEQLTKRALDWLDDRDDDRPFFLWVHYMDVHGPYQAKSGNAYLNKYRGEHLWRKAVKRPDALTDDEHQRLLALYRAEIEYTDRWIGELLDGLRARGLYDGTIAALTADHGELFGKDGEYSHPHRLDDELTHVPLFVRAPDRDPGRVETVCELVDVAPTLLDLAGVEPPAAFVGDPLPGVDGGDSGGPAADGADSAGVAGRPGDETPVAISEADLVPAYNGSVRTPEYRHVRNEVEGTEALYHLSSDPETDVTDERPEIRAALADVLDDHLQRAGRSAGTDRAVETETIEDAGVEERLQDLGYLQE